VATYRLEEWPAKFVKAFTAAGNPHAGISGRRIAAEPGGGHLRAGQIGGRADLETDGGNITVGRQEIGQRAPRRRADRFGDVARLGSRGKPAAAHSHLYVSGPMEVESSAGRFALTRVAADGAGSDGGRHDYAWLNPSAVSGGQCNCRTIATTSGNGDIMCFYRAIAADIERQGGVRAEAKDCSRIRTGALQIRIA